MKLTSKLVEELAQLRAWLAKKTKEESDLTDDIKDEFHIRKIDVFAPKNCPYLLEMIEYDQLAVDWKELAHDLAKVLYGAGWKKRLQRDIKSFGRETRTQLRIKPNVRSKVA